MISEEQSYEGDTKKGIYIDTFAAANGSDSVCIHDLKFISPCWQADVPVAQLTHKN